MKTFLEEVAEKIYKEHPRLEDTTIVFPNRRAALFFRKHLSSFLNKPAFAPRILTIEDLPDTKVPNNGTKKCVEVASSNYILYILLVQYFNCYVYI